MEDEVWLEPSALAVVEGDIEDCFEEEMLDLFCLLGARCTVQVNRIRKLTRMPASGTTSADVKTGDDAPVDTFDVKPALCKSSFAEPVIGVDDMLDDCPPSPPMTLFRSSL